MNAIFSVYTCLSGFPYIYTVTSMSTGLEIEKNINKEKLPLDNN